jgi:enamine deaminase RidA (YjgF/YER057c/UK114 family)
MTATPENTDKNDRRVFLEGGLLGLAAGSLGALSTRLEGAEPAPPQTARRTALFPPDVPAADVGYSPGILAEGRRVVFVSGQGPDDVKVDIETQIRQTFRRIGGVLAQAGASFDHVVMMRAYFVHLSRDLPVYRKVRKEFLRKPYPASTAVGTTELAIPGLEVEIEAIAIV